MFLTTVRYPKCLAIRDTISHYRPNNPVYPPLRATTCQELQVFHRQLVIRVSTNHPESDIVSAGDSRQLRPNKRVFFADPMSARHIPALFMATECIDAFPGYYVGQSGSTVQTPCPSGTYNPSESANSSQSCLDADPGHAVPDNGSSYQTPCTPGYYQSLYGQTSCSPAPPGYYVDSEGATESSHCLPGFWANQAGTL